MLMGWAGRPGLGWRFGLGSIEGRWGGQGARGCFAELFVALPGGLPGLVCPPCLPHPPAGDDIVIGKTSPIPDDGSGMPQRYNKKVPPTSLAAVAPASGTGSQLLGCAVPASCCCALEHPLSNQPLPPTPTTLQDASTALRHSESGMIDSVLVTTGSDGQRFVKMRVGGMQGCGCELGPGPAAAGAAFGSWSSQPPAYA